MNIRSYLRNRLLVTFLFIVISSTSFASSDKTVSDYVLIINSYTESAAWSRMFTAPIYERMMGIDDDIDVYTENMDVMLMTSESELGDFTQYLSEKYTKKAPKLIVMLGNSSYVLLRDELTKRWGNDIPYLICVEKDYIAPRKYYFQKEACPIEERENLSDITKIQKNITILYVPEYIQETISLMKRTEPNMKRILFIADKRYISSQIKNSVQQIMENNFPDIELELLTAGDIQTDELINRLQRADKETGILFFSWIILNNQGKRKLLSSDTYRMLSSYTNLPIFTLNDINIVANSMAGGFFYPADNISKTLINSIDGIISGIVYNNIITPQHPQPVLNYSILEKNDMTVFDYPTDTVFYMKPPTFWEQYHNHVYAGSGIALFFAVLLFARFKALNRQRLYQEKELSFMRNYSRLINSMPICYMKHRLICNEEGYPVDYVILDINQALETMLNGKDKFIGKKGTEINRRGLKRYMNACHLIFTENKKITTQYYFEETDRYFSVLLVAASTPGDLDIFMVDITEQFKTQQILRTVNQKLSMSLDVANVTPWKWDLTEHAILCDVNRAANFNSSILFDENQLTVPESLYFSKVFKEDRKKVEDAYKALLSGKVEKIKEEYRIYNPEKGPHGMEWVEACATVEKRDEDGKPLTLVGSSLIITKRKEVEKELLDAKNKAEESNRLKSAFLANMSHEIRTPLNAIVGFSNILAETEEIEEKHEYVQIIENNNALLLQLISDILDLSKIEAGTLEFIYTDTDINTLLTELGHSMQKRVSKNVQIIFEQRQTDCFVSTAKNRLMQILINLLTNAIKFTEEGSIRFGYSSVNKKMLRFYVTDTGCGITEEQQKHIFERFVKLNAFAQGTGLGLSICQMIINHLGGEMGVESEIGKGSTFWFTFPCEPAKKAEKKDIYFEKKIVDKEKLTVLIAEDNAGNFKLYESILKKDYTIIHAWNGQEAVDLYQKHGAHIILMDINMPEMNGYEATTEIRKISPNVPIIAVTAYAFSSDEEQIMNSGFDAYTAKPLNALALKKQMGELLKKRLLIL